MLSQSIPSYTILEELIDDNILEEDDFNNGDYDPPENKDTIKFTSTRKSYTIEEKLFFVNLLKEITTLYCLNIWHSRKKFKEMERSRSKIIIS